MAGQSKTRRRVQRPRGTSPQEMTAWTFMAKSKMERDLNKLKEQKYPFENLVLEGGGVKLTAYPGALQGLEDIGILQNIKRFCGSSGGAIVAMCLALRYTPKQIENMLLNMDQRALFMDAKCGLLNFLPNLVRKFGWHPAKKIVEYGRKTIKEASGNPDLTFKQLYDQFDKTELCITATNLTTTSLEYFHVKTSPDLPIIQAVRASISIPGVLQPLKLERNGMTNYYVDGGILNNYPINAFDGWFLSMENKDSFFQKLGTDEDFFGTINPKTLGMMLFSGFEGESVKHRTLNCKPCKDATLRPSTKLSKKHGEKCEDMLRKCNQKFHMCEAVKRFMQELKDSDIDKDGVIDLIELKYVFDKSQKNPELKKDMEILFGKSYTFNHMMNELDRNHDSTITFQEFTDFVERKGLPAHSFLQGTTHLNINNAGTFFSSILETLDIHIKNSTLKKEHLERTIGIFTDYISTLDTLETEDCKFLAYQGKVAAITYVKEWLRMNKTDPKFNLRHSTASYSSDDEEHICQCHMTRRNSNDNSSNSTVPESVDSVDSRISDSTMNTDSGTSGMFGTSAMSETSGMYRTSRLSGTSDMSETSGMFDLNSEKHQKSDSGRKTVHFHEDQMDSGFGEGISPPSSPFVIEQSAVDENYVSMETCDTRL